MDPEYESWRAARFFPTLDGLRAISVLLVLAAHTPGSLLEPLHGHLGVTVFFVISGLLITTLLLREEEERSKVSLRAFYLRRAFRIFPLYFLALLVFSAAVGAGLARNSGNYPLRVIHFVTFTNEYASPGTFGHSWSLGIEEKFYLLWPIIGFVAVRSRAWRGPCVVGLLVASTVTGVLASDEPLSFYSPILAGCALALLLHRRRSFVPSVWIARPTPAILAAASLIVLLLATDVPGRVDVLFGLAVAVGMPVILFGPRWLVGWMRSRIMLFVGRRSYAVYLFHPLVGSLVAKGIPRADGVWPLANYVVTLGLTLIVADILYRVFERPLIGIGHELTARIQMADRSAAQPNNLTVEPA